jgi:hypothetical protein
MSLHNCEKAPGRQKNTVRTPESPTPNTRTRHPPPDPPELRRSGGRASILPWIGRASSRISASESLMYGHRGRLLCGSSAGEGPGTHPIPTPNIASKAKLPRRSRPPPPTRLVQRPRPPCRSRSRHSEEQREMASSCPKFPTSSRRRQRERRRNGDEDEEAKSSGVVAAAASPTTPRKPSHAGAAAGNANPNLTDPKGRQESTPQAPRFGPGGPRRDGRSRGRPPRSWAAAPIRAPPPRGKTYTT